MYTHSVTANEVLFGRKQILVYFIIIQYNFFVNNSNLLNFLDEKSNKRDFKSRLKNAPLKSWANRNRNSTNKKTESNSFLARAGPQRRRQARTPAWQNFWSEKRKTENFSKPKMGSTR